MEQPKVDNRRKHSDAFSYFLVIVASVLFLAILGAMTLLKSDPIISSIIQNWGTILLTGIIVAAAAYQFGSSKGSAMKDEMAAIKAPPQAQLPPQVQSQPITMTTNVEQPKTTTSVEQPKES